MLLSDGICWLQRRLLQFIVTTGNRFTSFCFDSGRDSPEKLVFVTYVYSVTHSSKLVKSAVQVIGTATSGKQLRATAVEALKAPYCVFECGKKPTVWALQQLANDAFRINLMPQVNCYKDNRVQRVSLIYCRTQHGNFIDWAAISLDSSDAQ